MQKPYTRFILAVVFVVALAPPLAAQGGDAADTADDTEETAAADDLVSGLPDEQLEVEAFDDGKEVDPIADLLSATQSLYYFLFSYSDR